MLNKKTLTKLLGITLICAVPVVLILLKTSGSTIMSKDTLFLPNLLKNKQQIAKLIIQDHDRTLTLQRANDTWQIVERNNYPVLHDKVEELLYGLADLRIVEPKTTNSQLYGQLDVNDISDSGAKSILITVQDSEQHDLAKVIIGKREGLQLGEDYSEHIFVRKADDTQTWLVQGLLPLSNDIKDWVEQPLLGLVDSSKVKKIIVSKTDGNKLTISKTIPEQEDFILETAVQQPGMTLDVDSINTLPFEVAELEFEDVLLAADQNIDWSSSITAELETFPGVTVALNFVQRDGVVFAKAQATAAPDATADVQQQVSKFNAEKETWVYKLPADFYKTITVNNTDFLRTAEVAVTTDVTPQ